MIELPWITVIGEIMEGTSVRYVGSQFRVVLAAILIFPKVASMIASWYVGPSAKPLTRRRYSFGLNNESV